MKISAIRGVMGRRWGAWAPVAALAIPALLFAGDADLAPADTFPPGSDWHGLPVSEQTNSVYARAPDAPLNELHRLLFVAQQVPEEVGAALPVERSRIGRAGSEFFRKGWYFEKRRGEDADRRAFGGDIRVSPVLGVDSRRSARLVEILGTIATPAQIAEQPDLQNPLARLLVQWDLLSLWWRFEREKVDDPVLLKAMARSIRALGQPRTVLDRLPSGANQLREVFSGGDATDTSRPLLPLDLFDAAGRPTWPELDRKSTKLFHAEHQLRASRVFIGLPRADIEDLLAGDPKALPTVGIEHRPLLTALVLTLMAIDDTGRAVATPVIDELRVRAVVAETDAPTSSSRDGSSHWIYLRSRRQSLVDTDRGPFRFVPDDSQSLFLEYGTAKHTTYFAQCALCHRLTNAGGQTALGIRSLSQSAQPRLVDNPNRRFDLAVAELRELEQRLADRLDR